MRDGVEDVYYRPPGEGLEWLRVIAPERCLVLGVPTEHLLQEVAVLGAELRTAPADRWDKVFHAGSYAVRIDADWFVMVVGSGLTPTSASQARDRAAEGHLGMAIATLPLLWPTATPHSGSSNFSVNDVVRPRGERRFGRVRKVIPRPHGHDVYVLLDGAERQFSEAALEKVEGDPLDPDFWVKEAPASAEDIAFTLTWTKLRHPLTDTLYSYASSKTVFRAYQFVPVLKLLSSSTGRLLIADEVGLGKTIEAGLIWSELEQRTRLDRVLVVTPASLTLKCSSEQNLRLMTEEIPFFARAYKTVLEASRTYTAGLEPVFYNAHNDFTWQSTVLLAPLTIDDDDETVRRKLAATATYLDIWIMRRTVNYVRVGYSTVAYAMWSLTRDIRRKPLPELVDVLQEKLAKDAEDISFEGSASRGRHGITDLRLNQFSGRYIYHLLARFTAYVESQSGLPDIFDRYVDRSQKNGNDIEHIWADIYSRFSEDFPTEQEFDSWRNNVAGLVLLPADVNRSYQAKTFREKAPHYAQHNLYAASLTDAPYTHRPQFTSFVRSSGLPFRAYEDFRRPEQEERRQLVLGLAKRVWDPARLEQYR